MTPFTMHWYPSEGYPEGVDAYTPEEMRDAIDVVADIARKALEGTSD